MRSLVWKQWLFSTVYHMRCSCGGMSFLLPQARNLLSPFSYYSMVTFLTSIAIACFFGIDGWPNTLVKLIYALSWFFVIPLILWTVITGWETTSHTHVAVILTRKWWLEQIKNVDRNFDVRKLLARLLHRKKKGKGTADAGTIEMGGPTTATPEPITPTTDDSGNATVSTGQRPWRVRVKNFGPVRHFAFPRLSQLQC